MLRHPAWRMRSRRSPRRRIWDSPLVWGFAPVRPGAKGSSTFLNSAEVPYLIQTVLWIRIGFNADTDPVFNSMRIRIQEAWPMRIRIRILVRLLSQKNLKFENMAYLFERLEIRFVCNFLAPWSGSAFPIRIRIQESQINADPDPQHFIFKQCR